MIIQDRNETLLDAVIRQARFYSTNPFACELDPEVRIASLAELVGVLAELVKAGQEPSKAEEPK